MAQNYFGRQRQGMSSMFGRLSGLSGNGFMLDDQQPEPWQRARGDGMRPNQAGGGGSMLGMMQDEMQGGQMQRNMRGNAVLGRLQGGGMRGSSILGDMARPRSWRR